MHINRSISDYIGNIFYKEYLIGLDKYIEFIDEKYEFKIPFIYIDSISVDLDCYIKLKTKINNRNQDFMSFALMQDEYHMNKTNDKNFDNYSKLSDIILLFKSESSNLLEKLEINHSKIDARKLLQSQAFFIKEKRELLLVDTKKIKAL